MDSTSSPTDEYTYKAFISYSHAADERLAPALQSGLHRFAKPWYRLRAMRAFRDETTLATSPELWPSIESAMRQSEYFLFLASPEAAQSYWVRKEFEFWVHHRSKDQMLIILTDGELIWDRETRNFDWTKTTAVPQGIANGFRDEPLYLDLRWAKTEEQLSLKNPAFRSAIADVASTLLDRPKDELIGEDIRRHIQTKRITWSAVAALVVLTALSVIAAVVAVQKQREAERQQQIAEDRGAIALSRQLASQAVSLAGSDQGDLALLLSLEALNVRPTVDARNGLLAALTRDPRRLFHLHGHMGEVTSLTFTADGQELLSLGCEGIDTLGLCKHFGVRRWDASSGEPKGQTILPSTNRWTVLTKSVDGESLVARDRRSNEWDPVTGRSLGKASLPGLTSPDGKILAERSRNRMVLRRMDSRRRLDTPMSDEGETIRSVAFHPTAPLVAIGGSKGEVRLWDTNELLKGSQDSRRIINAHSATVIDLDFSPDGRYLVTASWDDSVLAWELESETSPHRLVESVDVSSVTFSQDGRRLIVALSIGERGGELQLWDTENWRLITTLAGKAPVSFAPDGRHLAAAGSDGSIIVRDLDRDRPLGRTMENPGVPMSLTFLDGDDRYLVAGGRDQTLRIWNVENRRLERPPIPTEQGWINALAAHPDGKHVISGGQDGSIFVWDLESHTTEARHQLIGRHNAPIGALDFSADGHYIVSGDFDDTLRFWKMEKTGKPLSWPPIDTGHDVYAVEFDRSASRVAAATEDGSVLIWQLTDSGATGSVVGTHSLQSDGMTGLAFGPEDRFLVSSSLEQTQLWDLEQDEPRVHTPIEGNFAVLEPRGELVALVTDNNEIQLVDVGAWRMFDSTLGRQKDVVYAMAFSPDGRQLASAAEGDIVLWDVDLASWRTRACSIARRNLTAEEWERYVGDQTYRTSCPNAKNPAEIPLDAERALGLAVRATKLGESAKARRLFAKAARLTATGGDAELANEICWFGALRGAFSEVMVACERAVELDHDNGSFHVSRGLARAQLGNTAGAIKDFRTYLAAVKNDDKLSDRRSRRQAWINALEAGQDPFDSMELHRIRSEGPF